MFKGNSLIQFCSFRELLENKNSRKIIGFDRFDEFPEATIDRDKKFRKEWVKSTNNEYITKEELYKSLKRKNVGNVELIQGDITHTLKKYIEEHPELRISMLHIDSILIAY